MKEQIKSGYKQTEVGIIPNDWEVVQMGNIGEPIIGLTYKPSDVSKHGLLVLRSSNIQNNRLSFENNVFVKIEVPERVIVKTNDLLICVRNGSKQLIGKCVLIDKKIAGSAFGAFMSVFRSKYNKFILFQFQSNIIGKQINDVMGATINQITNKNLAEFKIPLPPSIAEQEKIAEALSDVDSLIESLEEAIAKKRHIKQGAMQELLTGKKRLINNGEWRTENLGNITDIRSGGTPSTNQNQFWDGDILWCTPTDITKLNGFKYLDSTARTITEQGLKFSSAELLPPYSVVMTSRATIGECAINKVPLATNQGFKNFIPSETIDVSFLYYLLQTKKQDFISLCAGSTFLEINKSQLSNVEISIPPTKAEQEAIAEVLSDMDNEITALEEKLNKTHQIKQGMMQELLTGKTRLI